MLFITLAGQKKKSTLISNFGYGNYIESKFPKSHIEFNRNILNITFIAIANQPDVNFGISLFVSIWIGFYVFMPKCLFLHLMNKTNNIAGNPGFAILTSNYLLICVRDMQGKAI